MPEARWLPIWGRRRWGQRTSGQEPHSRSRTCSAHPAASTSACSALTAPVREIWAENPCAGAGDPGSIPKPGRPHVLWSNWACAPPLLSLWSAAWGPQPASPGAATADGQVRWNPRSTGEAAMERSLGAATREEPLFAASAEGPTQQRRPSTTKNA